MSTPAAKKMKLDHEGSPVPSSSTPTPAPTSVTPAPTYTTTQWSSGQIPIDPALQQQSAPTAAPQQMIYPHFQPYGQTTHPYPYAHYQYQAPQPVSTPQPASTPVPTAAAPVIQRQPTQTAPANTAPDTSDIATLNDALGSAGVDLRAEEENLARSQDHHTAHRSYEDRSRKQPHTPSFDTRNLQSTMLSISKMHKVSRIPEDSINYVALALRHRLEGLLKSMIGAATHRAEAQFDREPSMYDDQSTPMWNVVLRRDTRKILDILEKVEREEEMKVRRERKKREDAAAAAHVAAAAALASGASGSSPGGNGLDGTGAGGGPSSDDANMSVDGAPPPKKPKKKKDGPGVTARNLSEDVQKRLSNAVATQAAGIGRGKYAWMNAGSFAGGASSAGKGKAAAAAASSTTTTIPPSKPTTATSGNVETAQTPPANGAGTSSTVNGGSSTAQPPAQPASSWSKPYVSSSVKTVSQTAVDDNTTLVTMRDAMFVIERERGHGAGRGAARAWV